MYLWMHYLAVRKISAGTSVRPANRGEMLFTEQTKVDTFLKNYKVTSSLKSLLQFHCYGHRVSCQVL